MTPWDKLREECGVFGIRTEGAPAAPLAHLGLYALQHRGQESAGIATFDGARTHLVKDMGLVAAVFTPDRLETLSGPTGIGHVRYSTAGESLVANAHPILVDSIHGQLAVCHNGNLVNAGELHDALVRSGAIFQTNSDTEVVVHLFARSREEGVEGLGLRHRAREAVEHAAGLGVGLLETLAHEPDDHIVGDEAARVHVSLGLEPEGGLGGHGLAQHVAGGDVGHARRRRKLSRLGALARAGRSEKDDAETHACARAFLRRKPS